MIKNTLAETLWCPFALVQSEVKECDFSGEWVDESSSSLQSSRVISRYKTKGKIISVTSINRNLDGSKNTDCLCITNKCVFWRELGNDTDGEPNGDCSKLNDNANHRFDFDDLEMKEMHCPHARPENEVIKREWTGTISGCTNAITNANRVSGNVMHPSSKCITKDCMAYITNGLESGIVGYCMSADKNMQRK
jgi:hypothetical protein